MVCGVHWSVFSAWVVAGLCVIFSFLYFFLAKKEKD